MNDHKWDLYSKNKEAWNSMLEDCSKAKESIILEQYHFVKDGFGQKLLDICKERSKNGVKIRFLWDATGSFTFWGSSIVEELKNAGIELRFWRTLIPSFFKIHNYRAWYFRNHRRTLVIDNKIGYTGSLCVDNEFKNWRDTNVRIEGSVVKEMAMAFEDMWSRSNRSKLRYYTLPPLRNEFRYVTNYPLPGRRYIYKELINAIQQAKDHIYITTPYFVPTHKLIKTLKSASKRGVKIDIIIPEKSDYFIVDLGARAFFKTLLQNGIRIYLYQGNVIHSKTVTIDQKWSTVGTMNLDSISLLYNFEANLISTNKDFAIELQKHFSSDQNDSKQVTLDDWQNRSFLSKVFESLAHLLKRFL